MSKNLMARPAIFLISLSFFYLQACNNSSTEAANTAVDSSTLKNDTAVVKQETPATTSTSDSITSTTAAEAIAKAETAEAANKTRVSPNKKSDAKPTAEKPEAAPKVDHASIEAGKSLLATSDCLTCHKVQEKVIGPAYTDIAKKYPDSEANVQLLSNKIISGGSGVWGQIPMTPHPSLQADDVKKMVMYILSLD